MNLPINNTWVEFKRQHPAGAEAIKTIGLQLVSILVVVVCAFYALKCKPFQDVSMGTAHPEAHTAPATAKAPGFPVRISLAHNAKSHAN